MGPGTPTSGYITGGASDTDRVSSPQEMQPHTRIAPHAPTASLTADTAAATARFAWEVTACDRVCVCVVILSRYARSYVGQLVTSTGRWDPGLGPATLTAFSRAARFASDPWVLTHRSRIMRHTCTLGGSPPMSVIKRTTSVQLKIVNARGRGRIHAKTTN